MLIHFRSESVLLFAWVTLKLYPITASSKATPAITAANMAYFFDIIELYTGSDSLYDDPPIPVLFKQGQYTAVFVIIKIWIKLTTKRI